MASAQQLIDKITALQHQITIDVHSPKRIEVSAWGSMTVDGMQVKVAGTTGRTLIAALNKCLLEVRKQAKK